MKAQKKVMERYVEEKLLLEQQITLDQVHAMMLVNHDKSEDIRGKYDLKRHTKC